MSDQREVDFKLTAPQQRVVDLLNQPYFKWERRTIAVPMPQDSRYEVHYIVCPNGHIGLVNLSMNRNVQWGYWLCENGEILAVNDRFRGDYGQAVRTRNLVADCKDVFDLVNDVQGDLDTVAYAIGELETRGEALSFLEPALHRLSEAVAKLKRRDEQDES